MSLFRPSREKRGPDPLLHIKVAVFCLGAGIAVAGVASNTRWLINVAIGVLVLGFLLRFVRRPPPSDSSEPEL